MKSPTLAIGYWNDSVNTFRTRLNGYYLTGDLMYRDAEGNYYHVDRASDAIDLGDGKWLYTALSEERILNRCPDVRDCTVLAVRERRRHPSPRSCSCSPGTPIPALDRDDEVRAALGQVGRRRRRGGSSRCPTTAS